MRWLPLVGSLKLQVTFAEYSLFNRALWQKRPIILRSLLIVAILCGHGYVGMACIHDICTLAHISTRTLIWPYYHIPHASMAKLSCYIWICGDGMHIRHLHTGTQINTHAHADANTRRRTCSHTTARVRISSTGWRRPKGCLKLQVSFRKRATNYRALSRKITYKDKAS